MAANCGGTVSFRCAHCCFPDLYARLFDVCVSIYWRFPSGVVVFIGFPLVLTDYIVEVLVLSRIVRSAHYLSACCIEVFSICCAANMPFTFQPLFWFSFCPSVSVIVPQMSSYIPHFFNKYPIHIPQIFHSHSTGIPHILHT